MLKIEKSKKNNEINIQIRHPSRLLDRYFLLALGTALGGHLLAALLFHVHLFTLGEIETTLPPTRALAHYVKSSPEDKSEAFVSAQINREGRLTPAQLAPPGSLPLLPELPPPHHIVSMDYHYNLKSDAFAEIEKDSEDSNFTLLDIPIIASPLKVSVAGPLAELSLQTLSEEMAALIEPQKFPPKNLQQEHIVYAVEVDIKSGKIFWFQPIENSLDHLKQELAEKILKGMVFQTDDSKDFVQSGQVEITFTGSHA